MQAFGLTDRMLDSKARHVSARRLQWGVHRAPSDRGRRQAQEKSVWGIVDWREEIGLEHQIPVT